MKVTTKTNTIRQLYITGITREGHNTTFGYDLDEDNIPETVEDALKIATAENSSYPQFTSVNSARVYIETRCVTSHVSDVILK